jgi:N,N'-diacetyllegionaminate synthase
MAMKSAIYTIADIGQAHDGSIEAAHAYIDMLSTTGVDAAKFQIHIAEAESSVFEPFRIQPSREETRMEYWKRMAFTLEEWAGLKTHCEDTGLGFLATPSSIQAVELLEKLHVEKFKIGSGDTCNLLMLDKISKTRKELIISTGMSCIAELDQTCAFLQKRNTAYTLLQCASAYPSTEAQWGLNQIRYLRERYQVPTGFSDHSGDVFACLAAATLGASILEFHVISHKDDPTPDASSSLTPGQIKMLIEGVRKIEAAIQQPIDKKVNTQYDFMKGIFEKSLSVNKALPVGHILTLNDLETKKPRGKGIPVERYEEVIGKTLNKNLSQWDFITENDII